MVVNSELFHIGSNLRDLKIITIIQSIPLVRRLYQKKHCILCYLDILGLVTAFPLNIKELF